jgi:hypothetical protein
MSEGDRPQQPAEGDEPHVPEPEEEPELLDNEDLAELEAAISELVEASNRGADVAQPLEDLPPERHLALQAQRQDIDLKESYARNLLRVLVLQLFIADLVFIVYAWAGKNWNIPSPSIDIWLGATLVEVIGVVLVVTQYLFPKREQ